MTRLERNADAVRLYALVHLAMGSTVMWTAINGGVPMPEAAHGGAVHTIPAEAWAAAVMGQALTVMLAMAFRLPVVVAVAAFFGSFINGFLAMFAGASEFGFLVARGAAVFAFLHACIAVVAAHDVLASALLKYGKRLRDD